jgi:GH24 family phage-related lysozyme (muramidase)
MPADFNTRIQNVQMLLGVETDGDFGLNSAKAFIRLAGINHTVNETQAYAVKKTAALKAIQKFFAIESNGVLGSQTLTAIENYLSNKLPGVPVGANMLISKASLNALIAFEVTSKAAYNSRYKNPIWPSGESGITIGIGYDIGYSTVAQFKKDWEGKITASHLLLLSEACGKTGTTAKNLLPRFKNAVVNYEDACDVFHQVTLPAYSRKTRSTYPGVQKLPPDAQGALLSLVYNRGTKLEGDSRKEMQNIVAAVASGDLGKIAREIRAMKRLWKGKGLDGLLARRDAEAAMVENATFHILPADIIAV